MPYTSDYLPTDKTYDLKELTFEYVPAHPESFYRCYLNEGENIQVVYSFDYDDDCKCVLAYGDGKHWAYSNKSADWPILDQVFAGREAWKNFLAVLEAAELAELNECCEE